MIEGGITTKRSANNTHVEHSAWMHIVNAKYLHHLYCVLKK